MISFPEYAEVGKRVEKNKFYDQVDYNTRLLFQNAIEKITWAYKLAPNTINLPAKKREEIEVFIIDLKTTEVPMKALKAIDSAISYPILFLARKKSIEKAVIAYKEPNQKNANNAKVDTYFETEWNDPKLKNIRIEGLDIDSVYSNFLHQVAGGKLEFQQTIPDGSAPAIKHDIEALKEREKILKLIAALDRKYKAERSAAKRQEIATERYKLKQLL